MDAVYVYRIPSNGCTDELRYSLRSLANVVDVGQVWIVGDRPDWLANVRHIRTVQLGTKYQNSTDNIRAACRHPDMPETFAWWNDDFYAMQPTTIEPMHRGALADVIAHYRRETGDHGPYVRGMRWTETLLHQHGIAEPLSYELHLPMSVERDHLAKAIDIRRTVPLAHTRTIYGNLYNIGGQQTDDVKVYNGRQRGWRDWTWLSTCNTSFTNGTVGAHIRAAFPDPSAYEADQ